MRGLNRYIKAVIAFAILFGLIFGLVDLNVYAEGEWDETIYRVYKSDDQLSQAEIDSLDSLCCEFIETWKLDLVLMVVGSDDYSDELGEEALGFYDHNGFGYGENHDGMVAIFDEDNQVLEFRYVGAAADIFTDSFTDYYEEYNVSFYEEYGAHGVLYATYRVANNFMIDYYDEASSSDAAKTTGETVDKSEMEESVDKSLTDETTDENTDDTSNETTDESAALDFERDEYGLPIRNTPGDKPSWYPTDVDAFVEYHDADAPRVVDIADIFSDEEEKAMEERIAEVIEETGKDVVIFTDVQTYGLTREVYCYDFFDFCGYGCGDKYDGMCIFVCMDPSNRGWVASSTGVVEDIYTEEIANDMDDELYPYMKDGNYGEGILNWIENVYNLYTEGTPFVASWLPRGDAVKSYQRTNNPDSPRILDEANLFSETYMSEFKEKIQNIAEEYDVDAVVHTTKKTYGMSYEDYARKYYEYGGYGYGEDYDGVLLVMFMLEDGGCHVEVLTSGKMEEMSDVNYKRLDDQSGWTAGWGYQTEAAEKFLNNTEHYLRTGRVNKSKLSWFIRLLIATIAGWIFGGTSLSKARRKMATVKSANDADDYLSGSPFISPVCDTFLHETVTRQKIQHETSSSRSYESSSRSSYSSHSSGSSGRSHTSSTRNF